MTTGLRIMLSAFAARKSRDPVSYDHTHLPMEPCVVQRASSSRQRYRHLSTSADSRERGQNKSHGDPIIHLRLPATTAQTVKFSTSTEDLADNFPALQTSVDPKKELTEKEYFWKATPALIQHHPCCKESTNQRY